MASTQQHTPGSQQSLRPAHARATPMSESSVSILEEVYSPHTSERAPGGGSVRSPQSPSQSEAPSPVTSDVSSIEDEVRSTSTPP